MKRTSSLTNWVNEAEVIESRLATPVRISNEELERLKITINGYTFLNIPIIACPTCGAQSQIQVAQAPDEEVSFYLRFACTHYKNPKDEELKATEPEQIT